MRPTPNNHPAPDTFVPTAPPALAQFDLRTAEGRAEAALTIARLVNGLHATWEQAGDFMPEDDCDDVQTRRTAAAFRELSGHLWADVERMYALADHVPGTGSEQ